MNLTFTKMEGTSRGFFLLKTTLLVLSLIGLAGFMISYIEGHQVLGGSNIIPWGMPIVMAIYLIGLSAGLHILAFLIHILGRKEWVPIIRMAVFMAVILIFGAMVSIALDLGRQEKFWRLFTFFYLNNMASMFAANSIFYSCYLAAASIYLMVLFSGKERLSKIMGMVAFTWAMLTHGGTGLIFGLIASRGAWASALKPFEFIMAALTSSLALLVVVMFVTFRLTHRKAREELVISLGKLVAGFLCGLILLIWLTELAHGYKPDRAASIFMLSGPFSWLFWGFQIFLGEVIPLFILFHPRWRKTVKGVVTASALIVIGVFFERYYLVIPGLAYPQKYYPGTIEGVYGAVGSFPLTAAEMSMFVGMFAFVAFLFIMGLKHLELLPVDETAEQVTASSESPSA
jgi:molybdopterin-containing oxidoreductase family membrane subunit